jgi:hypothetical protein
MSRKTRPNPTRRGESPPKYVAAVVEQGLESLRAGTLQPGLYLTDVRHEEWCDLLRGVGPCNCNPHILPPRRCASPEDN